jgi:hypothetical protein
MVRSRPIITSYDSHDTSPARERPGYGRCHYPIGRDGAAGPGYSRDHVACERFHLTQRAGDIGRIKTAQISDARSGPASRQALSLPVSGAAKRASCDRFPRGAPSTHPAVAAARPTARQSTDVQSLVAPVDADRCRCVRGTGVMGQRSHAGGVPGYNSQPVAFNRMRQQRVGQPAGGEPAERAKAAPVLQFCSMTPTFLARYQAVVDRLWPNIDLFGDK